MKNNKIKTASYNWGEFHGQEKIELADIKNMVELSDELLGFTIRKEDEGKAFYADPDYIDKGEDGISVKWAYAAKNTGKKRKIKEK
jgi:hypothetical protein